MMGQPWDADVPSVELWKECLRTMKPGAFGFVMSAPRSDVYAKMIMRLAEAGFEVGFSPIFWTYFSGFPKAANISKLVDKKLGKERPREKSKNKINLANIGSAGYKDEAISDEAISLNGSFAGFNPKPAVEPIIVVMKPLSEKSYTDQALNNGKGITWLGDCRIPTKDIHKGEEVADNGVLLKGYEDTPRKKVIKGAHGDNVLGHYNDREEYEDNGSRFPANLLVSDDVLNDGTESVSGTAVRRNSGGSNIHSDVPKPPMADMGYGDSGSNSRFFDLDAWAMKNLDIASLPKSAQDTFPFLPVPKASKVEKNTGCDNLETKQTVGGGGLTSVGDAYGSIKAPAKNSHPTSKPVKLMSYLITMGSRKGDAILEPFAGSGTTAVAAKILGRSCVAIELTPEYVPIIEARLKEVQPTLL